MGTLKSSTLGKHAVTVTGASVTPADAVADAAALTSAQISGTESPTEAEYNQLQADVAALRTKVNALLASLRAGGIITT